MTIFPSFCMTRRCGNVPSPDVPLDQVVAFFESMMTRFPSFCKFIRYGATPLFFDLLSPTMEEAANVLELKIAKFPSA